MAARAVGLLIGLRARRQIRFAAAGAWWVISEVTQQLFSQTPPWQVGLIALAVMIAAFALGGRLRRYQQPRTDSDTGENYITSSIIGLLALLLAFTFGLAVERFDTRRGLVMAEANAIGVAFLRSQTFDEPFRSDLRGLLTQYVDLRLTLARTTERQTAIRLLAESDALQTRLWATTTAAVASRRDDVASAFMQSMNAVVDVAAERKAGRLARVPARVFVVLLAYMAISAATLGHMSGGGRRGSTVMLLVLLASAYTLILDIDSPNRGGVAESQAPMQDLKAMIAARE